MRKLWNKIRKWLLKKLGAEEYKDRVLIQRCEKDIITLSSVYNRTRNDGYLPEVVKEHIVDGIARQIVDYITLEREYNDFIDGITYRGRLEVVLPRECERLDNRL